MPKNSIRRGGLLFFDPLQQHPKPPNWKLFAAWQQLAQRYKQRHGINGNKIHQRGRTRQPGVGRIRCAVERGHAFLAQFGRIARRLDRCSRRYRGWIELFTSP